MNLQNYDWLLVGCHHISEVAIAYFPNYAHNCSAVKALHRSFREHSRLLEELSDAGYTPKTTHLTPIQIVATVRYWGLPSAVGEMVEKNPYLSVPKNFRKI